MAITKLELPKQHSATYLGLLTVARELGLSIDDWSMSHPDNYTGRMAQAVEAVAQVCSYLSVSATSRAISDTAQVFLTNAKGSEKADTLFARIIEELDAQFSALTVEDDFNDLLDDYKASDIKRAITAVRKQFAKLVEADGELVIIHTMYLDILAQGDGYEASTYPNNLVRSYMMGEDTLHDILAVVPAVRKVHRTWDRANDKLIKTLEFVEVTYIE